MSANRSDEEWGLVARQQAALAELAQFGLRATDEASILHEAARVTGATLGAGDVSLFEVLEGGAELVGRTALYFGDPVPDAVMRNVRIPTGRDSLPGYAASLGKMVVTDRLLDDPRFEARAPDFDIPLRAGVAAPIGWTDHSWGVLVVYHRDIEAFSDDEVRFVEAVAATTGLVIQRARIEAALRASSLRLDLSLEAGGLGAWSWNIAKGALTLNGSACAVFGIEADEFGGTIEEFLALIHPDDRLAFRRSTADALQSSDLYRHEFRVVRRRNGEVRWVEVWGQLLERGEEGRALVGVSADVTERRRSEEQREALLQREQAARIEAESTRERLRFLATTSARLGASLDPDVAAAQVAELCVPAMATTALITVTDDDGVLVERGAKGVSPGELDCIRALRQRRGEVGTVGGIWDEVEVADSGKAILLSAISDDEYRRAAADAEHLGLYRRSDLRSAVVAPLHARGRVIGVVTLLRCGDTAVAYDDEDLALIEEMASRAALAIDNARLFHSRNRVARSLQAALLPPALPHIAGLELAAHYQVAETDVAIGGDFYDVIEVAPGQWGVVVGDVCGRGPDAAALTGLVRHSVRAATVRETLPSVVLAQTNAAVLDQIDDAKFCTAAYVRLSTDDAGDGSVAVLASSAGHPRPAVVRATGPAELLDCSGTLLGVVADPTLVDVAARLGPGDALVLYTDGVTEARRDHEQFGEERLLDVLSTLAGATAEEIAAGLAAAVDDFRQSARDDTAIMVARAVPSST